MKKTTIIIQLLFLSAFVFAQKTDSAKQHVKTDTVVKVYRPFTDTSKVYILYESNKGNVAFEKGYFLRRGIINPTNATDGKIESTLLLDNSYQTFDAVKHPIIDLKPRN